MVSSFHPATVSLRSGVKIRVSHVTSAPTRPACETLARHLASPAPRDPIRLLLDLASQYGKIVYFRVLGRQIVLLAHPSYVRHIFQENYRNYSKQTHGFAVLRTFLANGLLTSEGNDWLRQRRIVQPAFHHDRISGFAKVMTGAASALVDHWEAASIDKINVTSEMSRLTLRIVGETLLSTHVSDQADRVGQALTIALHRANDALTRIVEIPFWVPTPSNRRLRRALATLDEVVYEMISARRRDGTDSADLLAMLMGARDEETGEKMSARQLRDEVMTIFLAGHETTAVALGWTWYLLSKYPAVARRLREELADVLGGRSPTIDELPRLVYTEQVIKEAMRLYPPAWIISRCAIDDDRIGGYDIPAGTIIFASPYITLRLPAWWENPEGFGPDRFTPSRVANLEPFAYFPFGGGPRQCIGNTFALMEMSLVVSTIAQRCRLDLVPGEHPGIRPAITLRPTRPILMVRRAVTSPARDAGP